MEFDNGKEFNNAIVKSKLDNKGIEYTFFNKALS